MCFYGLLSFVLCGFIHKNETTYNFVSLVDTRIGTECWNQADGVSSSFIFWGTSYLFGMLQLTFDYFSPEKGICVKQLLGGAWYVFASIGMYPMVLGVGGFSLNMPQFSDIRIIFLKEYWKLKGNW